MLKKYDKISAVNYALKWGLKRNPNYYNFDPLGGDCTNFVSQCVYAGSLVMNYSPYGWYYNSVNDRAPSWTGVEFFYNFLTSNTASGPFAIPVNSFEVDIGDVIILERLNGEKFHTLLISEIVENEIFVCSHTRNAVNLSINSFSFAKANFLHIQGVRS